MNITATTGLGDLDIEILALILEFVDDSSPKSTKSLAQVNRYFNATTKLVAHRHKTFHYGQDVDSWLDDEQLLRGVRDLTVEDALNGIPQTASEEGEATEGRWGSLVALIEKLGNLKTLIWNVHGVVPFQVLDALHIHHKNAELKVYYFERTKPTTDHNDPDEIALSKSPALTAIKTAIWNEHSSHPDLREPAFQRIVANAPNLRFASILQGHAGCCLYAVTDEMIEERDKAMAKFHTHTRPNSSLRSLTLDGFGMTEATLKSWASIVDMSQLESLKFSRGYSDISYFHAAPKMLPNLKHVSLNLSQRTDPPLVGAIEHYITTCAPLETLSLWSWIGVVPLSNILARHGETLRTLQLHERETVAEFGQKERKLLTVEEVRAIREACPNLQDFTFDLDRYDGELVSLEPNKRMFEELAQMKLAKLQIYYDLGLGSIVRGTSPGSGDIGGLSEDLDDLDSACSDDDEELPDDEVVDERPAKRQRKKKESTNLIRPSTNTAIESYVKRVWKAVFGNQVTGPRALDVKFGEWEKKIGGGYPARWVLVEQLLRTFWMVRPALRDDMLGECEARKCGEGYSPAEDHIDDDVGPL